MEKVIIIAYDINPNMGSEAGAAYIWADVISRRYAATVFTQIKHKDDLDRANKSFGVEYINKNGALSRLFLKMNLYNLDYLLFIRKAKERLLSLQLPGETLFHFLTPAGIHSFSTITRKLGIKDYMVGPIGGFLKLPAGFEKYRTLTLRLKELYYSLLIKGRAWKEYFLNAEKIIAGTERVARLLPEGCREKTEILFDTVVDTDFFDNSSDRKENREVVITYSGRIEEYKGCKILFMAFKKLLMDGFAHIRLIYAGEGRQSGRLMKMVMANGLSSKIQLLGRIGRLELKELLCASDIFCLPTLKDNGGTAILEAMACGLPVITTNYGGPSISVTGECGILIDPRNEGDYVEKLYTALKNLAVSRELRLEMGRKARERAVSHFSQKSLMPEIFALYQQIELKKDQGFSADSRVME